MIAFLAFQPNLSWNDLDNLEFIFGQISEGERFCNLVFENKGEGRGEMLVISFVSTLSKKLNLQFFWRLFDFISIHGSAFPELTTISNYLSKIFCVVQKRIALKSNTYYSLLDIVTCKKTIRQMM